MLLTVKAVEGSRVGRRDAMHAVMDGTNAIHIKPLKEGEVYGGKAWWRGSTDCIAGDYGHLLTCMWGADVNIPILLYAQKKPFFSFVNVGAPLSFSFLTPVPNPLPSKK